MATRGERLDFGPARALPSTWSVLPSERDKRPGPVIVTDPDGRVVARIDPITRQRTSVSGQVEHTLTPQGWGRPMHDTAGTVYKARPRAYQPDYEMGPRNRRDVDPRSGRETR